MESQNVPFKPVSTFPGKREYGRSVISVVNVKPFILYYRGCDSLAPQHGKYIPKVSYSNETD